jgi:hypothetical protein
LPIWITYSSHYDQIFTQGISIKFLFLKCSVCVSWKIASQEDVSWNLHSDTSTFITRKGRVSDSTCALPLQTKFQGWNLLGSSSQLVAVHAHLNWRLSQKGKNTKFLISFSTSRKFFCFFTCWTFTARLMHASPNCRSCIQLSTQIFILNDSKLFVNLLLQLEFSSVVWKWPWNLDRNIRAANAFTHVSNDEDTQISWSELFRDWK